MLFCLVRAAAALPCAAVTLILAQEPPSDFAMSPSLLRRCEGRGGGVWMPSRGAPERERAAVHHQAATHSHLREAARQIDDDSGEPPPPVFVPCNQTPPPGAGLLSSWLSLVVGTSCRTGTCPCASGTCFLASVRVGDKLMANGQTVIVQQVVSDTELIVSPDFDPGLNARAWSHVGPGETPAGR